MNANQIVAEVMRRKTPLGQPDIADIQRTLHAAARDQVADTMGAILYETRARAVAADLDEPIATAKKAKTAAADRLKKADAALAAADLEVRQAKSARVMLPDNTPTAEKDAADQLVAEKENARNTIAADRRAADYTARRRGREVTDLLAAQAALAAAEPPDLAPLRVVWNAMAE